jgi:uncharacterized protein YjbI with pentapeptide repeats
VSAPIYRIDAETEEALYLHALWLGGDPNGKRLDFSGGALINHDLSWRDLREAILDRCDLSGSRLEGAQLNEANLFGANLTNCDLESADLRWADLRRANLTGAKLKGARMAGAALAQAVDVDGMAIAEPRTEGGVA